MRRRQILGSGVALFLVALLVTAFISAHCEIPCGIYDDDARIERLREHTRTIEKSINSMKDLQKDSLVNYNQFVRWTMNKEDHANKLQDIVTTYFMTQRIKVPAEDADEAAQEKYMQELSLLHKMLVEAMKCKQTTDLEHVKNLRETIDAFSKSYLGKKDKGNGHGHNHSH